MKQFVLTAVLLLGILTWTNRIVDTMFVDTMFGDTMFGDTMFGDTMFGIINYIIAILGPESIVA